MAGVNSIKHSAIDTDTDVYTMDAAHAHGHARCAYYAACNANSYANKYADANTDTYPYLHSDADMDTPPHIHTD